MADMQKAIIYKGPGHFAYEDRPIPEIKDKNEVKIRSYGCAVCGTPGDDPGEFFWFLPTEGQLACAECVSSLPPETAKLPMPPGVRLAFCHVIQSEDKAVFSFKLSPDGEKAFADTAEAFTVFHLGGRFKSLDFYKSIL